MDNPKIAEADPQIKAILAVLLLRTTGTTGMMVRASDIEKAVGPFGGADGFDFEVQRGEKGGLEVWMKAKPPQP